MNIDSDWDNANNNNFDRESDKIVEDGNKKDEKDDTITKIMIILNTIGMITLQQLY